MLFQIFFPPTSFRVFDLLNHCSSHFSSRFIVPTDGGIAQKYGNRTASSGLKRNLLFFFSPSIIPVQRIHSSFFSPSYLLPVITSAIDSADQILMYWCKRTVFCLSLSLSCLQNAVCEPDVLGIV